MIDSSLFPKIYIKSIDLDAVFLNNIETDNPHVRDDVIVKQSPRSGRFVVLPLTDVRPGHQETDVLSIDVEAMFESNTDSSPYSNFINKDFMDKYLRVKIVMITSKDVMANVIDNFSLITGDAVDSLRQQGLINVATKYVSDIDVELTDDEEIQENIIRINFKFRDVSPDYLSILAYSYFDINAIQEDFNIDIEDNKIKSASSSLTIENVFNNGKIVSESNIFIDSANVLYNGPVEYNPETEEYSKYDTTEKLTAEKVPNTVVTDFRAFRAQKETLIDFGSANDLLSSIKNKEIDLPSDTKRRQYFTDLCITQDDELRAKMAFGINYKSILKDLGSFGALLRENDEARGNKMLKLSPIKKIEIARRRVHKIKRANHIGTILEDIEYFNDEIDNFVIADGSEKNFGSFQKSDYINPINKEVRGTIRELNISFNDLRFFTALDHEMKNVTDGLYSYYIKLVIEDGTITFVNNVYKKVEKVEKFISKYLQEALDPRHHISKTGKLNSFYKDKLSQKTFKWQGNVVEFTVNVSLLLNNLDDNIVNIFLDFVDPVKATIQTIQKMLEVVQAFRSFMERVFLQKRFVRNFSKADPIASDTIRKSSFLDNTITVEYQFKDVFDSNTIKFKGMEFLEYSNNNEIVTYDNEEGLSSMSIEKFKLRAESETKKYYNNVKTPISLNTTQRSYSPNDNTFNNYLSHFTVSKMNFSPNEREYMTPLNSYDVKKADLLELKLVEATDGGIENVEVPDGINRNEKLVNKRLYNLSTNLGITIPRTEQEKPNEVPEEQVFKDESFTGKDLEVNQSNNTVKASALAAMKNIANSYKNNQSLSLNEKVFETNKRDQSKLSYYYDLKTPINVLDEKQIVQKDVASMPNQIKSLFASSLGIKGVTKNIFTPKGGIGDITDENISSFILNYMNIVEVQGLMSFESNDRNTFVKKPIWEKLTTDNIESYPHNDMLCRIVRYDAAIFDKKEKRLYDELPIYNDYFILTFNKENKKSVTFDQAQIKAIDRVREFRNFKNIKKAFRLNSGVFTKRR